MDLRETLTFEGGRRDGMSIDWPDDDTPAKVAFTLRGLMTRQIAETLQLGWIYREGSDVPNEHATKIASDQAFYNVELKLEQNGVIEAVYPEKVGTLSVHLRGDNKFALSMKVHYTGAYQSILNFFDAARKDEFGFTISPRQKELKFDEGDTAEGGDRVDMTPTVDPYSVKDLIDSVTEPVLEDSPAEEPEIVEEPGIVEEPTITEVTAGDKVYIYTNGVLTGERENEDYAEEPTPKVDPNAPVTRYIEPNRYSEPRRRGRPAGSKKSS